MRRFRGLYGSRVSIQRQWIKTSDLSDFISQTINYMCYNKKSTEHGALALEHGVKYMRCVTNEYESNRREYYGVRSRV